MKRTISWMLIGTLFVGSCLWSYRFGIVAGTKGTSHALASTQAMLAFNHMREYEDLQRCLRAGRVGAVAERLRHAIISERELVAGFLRTVDDKQVSEYIAIRYNRPLDELRNFQSGRGSSWSVPACP